MDLQTLRSRIAEQVGISTSISGQNTRYNSWINETYKKLASEANWPWLLKRDVIQTVTDITTGTVSISAGDTALTFSSGPAASVANDYRIRFSDTDDWYDISAHTAGATSATLADAYLGDSAISAGTYTLRKYFYSLPSDVDRIVFMVQARNNQKLDYRDYRDLKSIIPDSESTGKPRIFSINQLDSSNNWQATFHPFPDAKMNIDMWYYRTITELSADSDTPIFPAKWHQVLVHGALAFFGWSQRNDTRRNESMANYTRMVEDMQRSMVPSTDRLTVITPWDRRLQGGNGRFLAPQFPSEFGVITL